MDCQDVFPENENQGDTGPIEAEVKWYNSRKGFGFVLGPDGQDVFFHASALTEAGIEPPDTGDKLVCEIGSDRQGRRLITRIMQLKKGEGGGEARPPRREFGGGGFGDRPPRRDFGDRPPRREFNRDEGGPTYDIAGTVKWFDQVRGFGFVTPEDGGQDVFLHSSVLQRAGKQDVQQGEKVALEVRDGQRGRQAVNMKD
ncbi:MAG: cold shock domain-containing protein [Acetobacteraceae bacterium]|nr:cold shock domain-containing protein [Acetobacteraceae bacterium]